MSTSAKSITLGLTRTKEARKRKERQGMTNLYEAVDQGWRYFWSRRSMPPPPTLSVGSHAFIRDQSNGKDGAP